MDEYIELPKSDLPINKLEACLSPKYLTNSYKLYWFLALMDLIKEEEPRNHIKFYFRDVIIRMISLCWHTLLEFKLNFGKDDQLQNVVSEIQSSTGFGNTVNKQDLITKIKEQNIYHVTLKLKKLERYVPYRFISPFISKIQGINDSEKNTIIQEKSNKSSNILYQIHEDSSFSFSPAWLFYLYKNQSIIEGWAKYKLVDFLQRRNPNVPAINKKIGLPQKRNLAGATRYWKLFLSSNIIKDIYSSEVLKADNISIDHFIPWKFVMHDLIWNLIPTVKTVNSSKNDRLPPWDNFFNKFSDVQFDAFVWHKTWHPKYKSLEDYLLIDGRFLNVDFSRKQFKKNLEKTIRPIYTIAENQGFEIWGMDNL